LKKTIFFILDSSFPPITRFNRTLIGRARFLEKVIKEANLHILARGTRNSQEKYGRIIVHRIAFQRNTSIERFGSVPERIWYTLKAFLFMLNKGKDADLLISMHFTANTISFLLNLFLRKKYVCDMVDFAFDAHLAEVAKPGLLRKISSRVMECLECRIIPKFSNEVIVVSEMMKDILIRRYGIDGEKIHVLPEEIDPDVLKHSIRMNEKKVQDLRQKYGLIGKRVVMTSGFVNWLDRADLLIEAFEQLKQRIPNLALVFVGDGDESFRAAVTKARDEDIIVTGWLPRMNSYDLLHVADVCVITMEKRLATDITYGSKLLDYIAFRKPVVCFNLETISKVVLGSRIGRVAQRTDASELADKIADVLQDPSSIDQRAFERLINDFSQFRTLASYAGIIEKAL